MAPERYFWFDPEIAKRVRTMGWLEGGEFELRSGRISPRYFDKYLPLSEPEILNEIVRVMAEEIDDNIHAIAGVETGGIILAAPLALQTERPLVVVRKKAKEYGTRKIIEGANVTGRNVAVVEDVITTGGAVLEAVHQLNLHGAHVTKVLCLMFRGDTEARRSFKEANVQLVPLLTDSDDSNRGN